MVENEVLFLWKIMTAIHTSCLFIALVIGFLGLLYRLGNNDLKIFFMLKFLVFVIFQTDFCSKLLGIVPHHVVKKFYFNEMER